MNWKKYSETEPSKEVETLTTTDFGQVKLGYGENAKTVENAVVLMQTLIMRVDMKVMTLLYFIKSLQRKNKR